MATSVPTTVTFLFVPFPKIVVLNDWETISVRKKAGGGTEQLVSASSAVAETLDLWCPQWGPAGGLPILCLGCLIFCPTWP